MQLETKTVQQNNLTFVLTPTLVIVRTGLGQAFYLAYRTHHWKKRLQVIRVMIELNQIRDLGELATWCAPGIEWHSTKLSYHKETL